MRKSLQTLGLSIFILFALLVIGIGFLFGMDNPVPWIMIAILVALPYVNKIREKSRFVAWKDDLSVSIDSIDDDHKKLLTLINNLQTAIYYPTGEAFERLALQELVDYTKYHFQREEDLMTQHGYPDYDAHKAQHDAMIAKVGEFLQAYEQDRENTVEALSDYLKTWLIKHIAGTDQQYSPYLRARGVL